MTIPPIRVERANSERPIYFGVSTDVLSTNFPQFVLAFINFLLILAWKIVSSFCRKEGLFRKLYERGKTDIVCGKIIGLLLQTTLPWNFLLLQNGFADKESKLNYTLSIFFFFFTSFFPLFYLYLLLKSKKNELILCIKHKE